MIAVERRNQGPGEDGSFTRCGGERPAFRRRPPANLRTEVWDAELLTEVRDGLEGMAGAGGKRKIPGQINLVAMTLNGTLGNELRAKTAAFLEAHAALDGVLFWSIARRDFDGGEGVLRPESKWVETLLRPAQAEDRWRNPFIVPLTEDWRTWLGGAAANQTAIEGMFAAAPSRCARDEFAASLKRKMAITGRP